MVVSMMKRLPQKENRGTNGSLYDEDKRFIATVKGLHFILGLGIVVPAVSCCGMKSTNGRRHDE